MSGDLKPCPFCGVDLYVRPAKFNRYGRCDTEGCWAYERKVTVPLEDPAQVAGWNRRAPAEADLAEFEVFCDEELVAGTSGPRDRALAEALHYAGVYGQDGAIQIVEITRTRLPLPAAPEVRS